ncbi:hypothetical protein [Rothia nasimurium]|uniref:hypothetical protein n=1 Tax=Rothia nasimurium TaxID=85336 RepID=UPI0016233F6A|nr:hypothetical protein [Rothia nasimurium]
MKHNPIFKLPFVAFIEVFVFSRMFTSCPTNLDLIYGNTGVPLIPLGYTCTWDSFPPGRGGENLPTSIDPVDTVGAFVVGI